jgi:Phage Mu protein F like protein
MKPSIDLLKANARGNSEITEALNAAPIKPKVWDPEFIDDLFAGIFAEAITEYDLPHNLYFAIADRLKEGLYKGFGGTLKDFKVDTKDFELLSELRENIFMFSAAKVFSQVREMTDALTNDSGTVRSFSEFKKEASKIFEEHNVNYLKTEFSTAIASGQAGAKWNDIITNKDLLPYLRITVVEDANTTEICEPLDGITLPIENDFWDLYYPPNHWGCRSTVEQLDEQDAGKLSGKEDTDRAEKHADEHGMQDIFKMNVGKDGYVFKEDHPYFQVEPKDRDFAKDNFGLEIPDKD